MVEVIMENLINIAGALLITLIGVLGTWLTGKIGKYKELANVNAAQQELIFMAQQTVGELQQSIVSKIKDSREDGKLTSDEMTLLWNMLYEKTLAKLSDPSRNLLNAAGVDIVALIRGAGEDWINSLKK